MASETARTVRWNIVVSPEVDRQLRQRLAEQGGRKGDLSRFVEQTVADRLFEMTVAEAQAQNADLSEQEMNAIIEEAIDWARGKGRDS